MPTIEELQAQVVQLQTLVTPLQTQVAALRVALTQEREGTALAEEKARADHAAERQAKAEARLVAAGKDRLAILDQLKASQLLERSKIREMMREMGGRFGEMRSRAAVFNQLGQEIEAAMTAWNALDEDTRQTAATVGEVLARLLALEEDLSLFATAIGRAEGLWHAMPEKERNDLAAEDTP